eukprot:CAMPEP_0179894738 /NCGR_PEP_ID=MMETSP0982-20121206/35445_1 /TAXON_ID=483367 /ORGANISM="non described non described, Strain CCMP 2436" /LENGTH=111 /DNA_ID=CAMNT_0021791347 /DNA_START=172 /DNA_END=504 /DNA_ORIENTATION=-
MKLAHVAHNGEEWLLAIALPEERVAHVVGRARAYEHAHVLLLPRPRGERADHRGEQLAVEVDATHLLGQRAALDVQVTHHVRAREPVDAVEHHARHLRAVRLAHGARDRLG